MILEQPAEFSKFISNSPPGILRWTIFRAMFPLFFFWWLSQTELILILSLIHGENLSAKIPAIALLGGIALTANLLVSWVSGLKIATKRFFQIDAKGIKIVRNDLRYTKWKQLKAWRLEPVPNESGLRKFMVEFSIARSTRSHAIILKHPDQTAQLQSEVTQLSSQGIAMPPLFELSAPFPRYGQPTSRSSGIWQMLLALCLFLHGASMLMARINHSSAQTDGERGINLKTPFARFILAHFNSREQFVSFFLIGGLFLMLSALFFFYWSYVIGRINQAERDRIESAAFESIAKRRLV